MENLDLPGIIFRVSVMYLYALALLRISGKQSVSHLTALDFIVTLIIGDLFDDIFWSEVPILQGLVGFAIIVVMHMLVTLAASRNRLIHHLVCSPPPIMVKNGKLMPENLRRERVRPEMIQAELRIRGEEHLKEVREARLEPNGEVSVLKHPAHKPVRKDEKSLIR